MEVSINYQAHTDVHEEKVPYSEPCDVKGGVVYVSQRMEWVIVISCKVPDPYWGHITTMKMYSTWTKPTARQIRKWKKETKKRNGNK